MILKQYPTGRSALLSRAAWVVVLYVSMMFMVGPWTWAQSPEQAPTQATGKGEEGERGDSEASDQIKTLEARLAEVDGEIGEASAQETA
ncbi:MAG TPA: hypothetical protein PKO23_12500, partial [Candidatus Hydrogenedentes bacterium]|nr:hypothetical protein [Candidatus Hydrogenedentota bacterium]